LSGFANFPFGICCSAKSGKALFGSSSVAVLDKLQHTHDSSLGGEGKRERFQLKCGSDSRCFSRSCSCSRIVCHKWNIYKQNACGTHIKITTIHSCYCCCCCSF